MSWRRKIDRLLAGHGMQDVMDFRGGLVGTRDRSRGANVHAAGLLAFPEDRPDESAEFAGHSDDDFRSADAAAHEFPGAAVEAILRDPGNLSDSASMSLLAPGELLADFGRQAVMVGGLDQEHPLCSKEGEEA